MTFKERDDADNEFDEREKAISLNEEERVDRCVREASILFLEE